MATQAAQTSASAGPALADGGRSRRRDRLRNFYGLDSGTATPNSTGGGPSRVSAPLNEPSDPLDPDGNGYDVERAFPHLLQRTSLAQLVKSESDLLTEIRELDGERQSLVYNHHHELVSASETMRKMKEQADALFPSMGALRTSLQSISSASQALQVQEVMESEDSDANKRTTLLRAQTVVALPQRLRDLILLEPGLTGLTKAQGLWGQLESVLAAWDEAGVKGAKEIMGSCRAILREAQQQQATAI